MIEALLAAALAASSHSPPGPRHLAPGVRLGEIAIPRIELHQPIWQGDQRMLTGAPTRVLDNGPAHYPRTKFPWQRGVAAFAGHRTTHTHPFLRLNELHRGDRIVLQTRWGRFTYHVIRKPLIVRPTQWRQLFRYHGRVLVLSACTPPHSARYRILVYARRL